MSDEPKPGSRLTSHPDPDQTRIELPPAATTKSLLVAQQNASICLCVVDANGVALLQVKIFDQSDEEFLANEKSQF